MPKFKAASALHRIFFCLLTLSVVVANNIYVSPNGDDSSSGIQEQPFKTLFHAVSVAHEGDTILLMSGTFSEEHTIFVNQSLTFVTASGMPDVVIAAPANSATILRLAGANVSIHALEFNGEGGRASCIVLDSGSLYLSSVNVHDCQSVGEGGAISAIHQSLLVAVNSTFARNTATLTGGAICFLKGLLSIDNCRFDSNCAQGNGGAISNFGSMVVNRSSFENNTVMPTDQFYDFGFGGALVNYDTAYVSLSSFSHNSARWGGALCNWGSLFMNATTCTGNVARREQEDSEQGSGGAIYQDGSMELMVTGSTFVNNSAVLGGGLFITYIGLAAVNDSTFIGNSAEHGGAVFKTYSGQVIFNRTDFLGNTALFGGALVSLRAGEIVATHCRFEDNLAQVDGGAIHIIWDLLETESTTSTRLQECVLVNNQATRNGGAILAEAWLVANASLFENNQAGFVGGAIFIPVGLTEVMECTFSGNLARGSGGAIAMRSDGNVSIASCAFVGNSAPFGYGGAVFNPSRAVISDSTFHKNVAAMSGGAIYTDMTASSIITGCLLTNNTASAGGALANLGHMEFRRGVICFCSAVDGGGVHSSRSVIADSVISNNRATNDGGGIYIVDDSSNWDSVRIECNRAAIHGHNLFVGLGSINCVGCLFGNCTTPNDIVPTLPAAPIDSHTSTTTTATTITTVTTPFQSTTSKAQVAENLAVLWLLAIIPIIFTFGGILMCYSSPQQAEPIGDAN